jgi:hypothetical protein
MYKFPSLQAEITYYLTGAENPIHITDREKILIKKFVTFHTEKTADIVQTLKLAKPYVDGAYECAFPNEHENEEVRESVNNILERFSSN